MKKIILIVLVFLICACSKKVTMNPAQIVNISETQILKASGLTDQFEIKAKAEATNGCWRDLHFVLSKENEFSYSLKAFGLFESNGICPAVMVYKDTLINFTPTQKGKYFFHINSHPYKIWTDTLIVN